MRNGPTRPDLFGEAPVALIRPSRFHDFSSYYITAPKGLNLMRRPDWASLEVRIAPAPLFVTMGGVFR